MEQPLALEHPSEVMAEVAQSRAEAADANDGLKLFHLKPPGMQGQELLDHMFVQWQIIFKTSYIHLYTSNACLDIAIKSGNISST
jgi:hypothetical protein